MRVWNVAAGRREAVTAGGAIAGLGSGCGDPAARARVVVAVRGRKVTAIVLIVWIAQDTRARPRRRAAGGVPAGPGGAGGAKLSAVQRSLLIALIAVPVLEAVVTTVIDLQFIDTVKGPLHRRDRRDRAVAVLRRHERNLVCAADRRGPALARDAQPAVHGSDPPRARDPVVSRLRGRARSRRDHAEHADGQIRCCGSRPRGRRRSSRCLALSTGAASAVEGLCCAAWCGPPDRRRRPACCSRSVHSRCNSARSLPRR